MSIATLLPVVLGIVKEGMVAWNQGRRTRFMKKHKKFLDQLSEAENKLPPEYTDAEVDISKEKLLNFLKAYHEEFKADNDRKYR